MRGILVRTWQDDPFRVEDLPEPEPGPGEVRIVVHTAPINYGDCLTSTGRYQIKPALPFIPGNECSGVIDRLGAGVSEYRVGQKVAAAGFIGDTRKNPRVIGGLAEKAVAPVRNILPVPDDVPLEDAALFRSAFETAWYGLQRARLVSGETLVVLGAAGSTGSAAVQLGKLIGARVIASASTAAKREAALAWGADLAMDTGDPNWLARIEEATGGKGADVVFDPVGGSVLERAIHSLRYRGRLIVIGFAGGEIASLGTDLLLGKGVSLIGANIVYKREHETEQAQADSRMLLGWLADGKLSVPSDGRSYALADAGAAIRDVLAGRVPGRALVRHIRD